MRSGRPTRLLVSDGKQRSKGGGLGEEQGVEIWIKALRGQQLRAAGVEDRCLDPGRRGLGEQTEDVVAASVVELGGL